MGPKPSSAGGLTEFHLHGLLPRPAPDLQRERLARLHLLDHVPELRLGRDRRAIRGDDDVAADPVGLTGDGDRGAARAQPGLGGAAARRDRLDDQAVAARQVERARKARRDRRGVDPEVGVLDRPRLQELRDDRLDGVDRDREADPGAGERGAVLGGADADHLAGAVDQRAARVLVVDRGVRLDRAGIAARQVDPVLDGTDDADGRGAAERERVADRDHGVTDLHEVGVAERQRDQRAGVGVDLEDGDVGRRVLADHGRVQLLAAREADLDVVGTRDDRLLVSDVPGLVDHEPRAEGRGRAAAGRPWC